MSPLACLVFSLAAGAGALEACRCHDAKRENGWCEPCGVGYVASIRVPSKKLFETLDAHGHDIDPAAIACASCKKAIAGDGFCDPCRMGFIGGRAYLSRLAYHAARGRVIDTASLACAACKKNAAGHGWCEACKLGLVGNFAVKERAELDPARKSIELLKDAIAVLKRCESCAIALFASGRCRRCKITYWDGKPRA